MAEDVTIRPFRQPDEDAVVGLWEECGLIVPQNDPRRDIRLKTAEQPDFFLVGELDGRVVSTVMFGYDGHRGWINYLAVAPVIRRRGVGRAMMAAAERIARECGCPKINLQVRRSNRPVLEFYRRIGFSEDDVVALGKRL